MGFEKIEHSEDKNENILKAEIELTKNMSRVQDTPVKASEDPKVSTLTSLRTLLDDLQAPEEEWPKEALRRVLKRFGRMPRSGWSLALSVFCGKFKIQMPAERFKKKASNALTSQSGKRCTVREFKKESTKRVKTLDVIFEENTLFEAKVYNEVKKNFLEYKKEVMNLDLDKVDRTRKVPNEKVNHLVLNAVARAVSESVKAKTPSNMSEITKTIQAARYHEPSKWRENIEKKIESWKNLITLLERVKRLEKLSNDEKNKLKAFMGQEGLKIGNGMDASEAISILNEKVLIFSKKIEMHEKRKQFSKENNSFELYRRRFYRSLSEGEERVEHNVPEADIKEFWS